MELSQVGREDPEKKSAVLHKTLINLPVLSNSGWISKYHPADTNITSILWNQTNSPYRWSCFQYWQQEIMSYSPCFSALSAPTIVGLGMSEGKSLPRHFNIHLSHLWAQLGPFWPFWCHLPLLPPRAGSPRLPIPNACLFLVLNWCPTNFTECHQIFVLQDLANISADSVYHTPFVIL